MPKDLVMPGQRLAELIAEAREHIPDAVFVLTDYGLDFRPARRGLNDKGGCIPFDTDEMQIEW